MTGAQTELAKSLKCLDQDRIHMELTPQKINWKFSPTVYPWTNGAMEATVQTIKKHLNTIIIESIINGRPLAPNSDDISDFEALTPNLFLIGTANPNSLVYPVKNPGDIVHKRKWKAKNGTYQEHTHS